MRIAFVSTNAAKASEVQRVLGDHAEVMTVPIEMSEHELDQELIVRGKASQAYDKVAGPVLVDDTGVYFERYNCFPGPLIGWVWRSLGSERFCDLIDTGDRAYFRTLICYKDADKELLFEGRLRGHLVKRLLSSETRMPISELFVPDGSTLTLAEFAADPDRGTPVLARTLALEQFALFLQESNEGSRTS